MVQALTLIYAVFIVISIIALVMAYIIKRYNRDTPPS
jgi:hypothetical protein